MRRATAARRFFCPFAVQPCSCLWAGRQETREGLPVLMLVRQPVGSALHERQGNTAMTIYGSSATAARHLQMLLDEKFEHDNVTRWVLFAASNAARQRAHKTGDLDDNEIVGLLTAVEDRGESTHLEQAIRNAIDELCTMLGVGQEAVA